MIGYDDAYYGNWYEPAYGTDDYTYGYYDGYNECYSWGSGS
jgi:hypothetical protein